MSRLLLLLLPLLASSPVASAQATGSVSASHWSELTFGHRLPSTNNLDLWWCESAWKVLREHQPPALSASPGTSPVHVSLARGEYEAVQIVLRPGKETSLVSAQLAPLKDAQSETSSILTRIDEVAYLEVKHPSDKSSRTGWYPDPLPPLKLPLLLRAQQNQPLWITFFAPTDLKGGKYLTELTLKTGDSTVVVPIQVSVFNFELPRETHLKSAFGLGAQTLNPFHHLTNQADKEAVLESYLQNFAEHRISPYSFFDYSPIQIKFTGEGGDKRAQVDFTAFDKAASKWLDRFHFNSFKLPLRGMGGGTFHSRHLGELEGFAEGTPEHARLFHDYLSQIEKHLRGRGWLEKAYTYWFDEPDPKDYEFVIAGMKRLKDAAPGIKRMLTEQPEPALSGHVEIWCGLTPEWTPEKVRARSEAGEEVWWYICTVPKAPHVTLFIDHPGIELRLWPWQSWQYGVSGILVWASTYWTSPAAFPPPKQQNPWEDPMGYVSGYDFKPGHVGYWGNGDGRFLYPPRTHKDRTGPNLEPPVNSLRWENLRDGMEDYEYLWLLNNATDRAQKQGARPDLVAQARELRRVPPEVSKDLTRYAIDPRPLLTHRERLAAMIAKLGE